ncbi:MAG TPA: hypothetical protein VNA16_02930 [Abditibacteriaceae bacterium]|nr:hypothetical protein [Abditibacteriaceae bacterium]
MPSGAQADWLPTAAGGIKLFALLSNLQGLLFCGIFSAVVSIVLLLFAPWQITLPVMLLMGIILVFQVITVKRIGAVEMDPTKRRPGRAAGAQVTLGAEEKVLGMVTGLMHTGWRVESFGVGHLKNPHNAMVITSRHVFLLFVPLPGGDVMVGDTDMSLGYFMLGKKKVKEKLEEMLSAMSLQEIVNSDAGNIALLRADLLPVQPPKAFGPFKSVTLTLVSRGGQNYSYSFRDQSDLASAVQLLTA